jgi:hypothetical protein
METVSTFDMLKKYGVKERDISMFNDRMKGGEGSEYKDLAKKYGVKSPVTVSRRIKKVQKALAELDKGVKLGNVLLQSTGVVKPETKPSQSLATTGGGTLSLPRENPFLALETFTELSGITSAGGSVIGMGAATLMQGFTREDLPYEDRQKLTMKGASVLAGGLLAAYLTYMKFTAAPGDAELKVMPESGENR